MCHEIETGMFWMTMIHEPSTAVLLLVLLAMVVVVQQADSEKDEELDPFDMVNFDHVKMKMKKSTPPVLKSMQPEGKPKQDPPADEPARESSTSKDEEPTKSMPPREEDRKAPVVHESARESSTSKEEEPTKSMPPGEEDRKAHTVHEPVGESSTSSNEEAVKFVPPSEEKKEARASQSCPALSLFQQFVARFLRSVRGKVSQLDEGASTTLCVYFKLTRHQVEMMESFKQDHTKDRVFSAHEVLTQAIQGARVLDSGDPSLNTIWLEERLGVPVAMAQQVLTFIVLLVALAVLLCRLRLSKTLLIWMLFLGFWFSVATTWYRLYKGEVAKQHEAMMKDQPRGCGNLPDGSSPLGNVFIFLKSYFTFQQDECIAYYEHLIVDPIVKVSVMEALAVAVVQSLLKPMRTVGMEMSEFLRALVKDLPVQWQLPYVLIAFGIIILVLFLSFGYRLRTFFLAIEPSHRSDGRDDLRALERKIEELQAMLENKGSLQGTQHSPALLQAIPAVAALSTSSSGQAAERGEKTLTETSSHLPASQSPDDNSIVLPQGNVEIVASSSRMYADSIEG